MITRLPIDTKSLYLNVKNDNPTGHTPTVATPLRQGASVRSELARILNIPELLSESTKERLSLYLLSKTRADAKINKAYVFSNIAVNGKVISVDASYCIYIREEINPTNVHFGRQKVHYPQILEFEDDEVYINNNSVLRAVSHALHDYAFYIQAFEYDDTTGILNFDARIIGEPGVPYSKVFVIRRGVGAKFSSVIYESADTYDIEIIPMRQKLGFNNVFPENFADCLVSNKKVAISEVVSKLDKDGIESSIVSDEYPYSLYDIETKCGQQKRYVIIKCTATPVPYFNLSYTQIRFINDFSGLVDVVVVTDVNGSPKAFTFDQSALTGMKKNICSVTYEYRGENNE